MSAFSNRSGKNSPLVALAITVIAAILHTASAQNAGPTTPCVLNPDDEPSTGLAAMIIAPVLVFLLLIGIVCCVRCTGFGYPMRNFK